LAAVQSKVLIFLKLVLDSIMQVHAKAVHCIVKFSEIILYKTVSGNY